MEKDASPDVPWSDYIDQIMQVASVVATSSVALPCLRISGRRMDKWNRGDGAGSIGSTLHGSPDANTPFIEVRACV